MFRIAIEEGKPDHFMLLLCDNPRCRQIANGQIAPGTPELVAIQGFFNALSQQHGWLILPHGHYCQAHKHAFVEPMQRSLIVPAVGVLPKAVRN